MPPLPPIPMPGARDALHGDEWYFHHSTAERPGEARPAAGPSTHEAVRGGRLLCTTPRPPSTKALGGLW